MSAVRDEVAPLGPRGAMWAYLPLALLLAVRAHDRPGEYLEDENLTASLPRRLGLSDVIDREIRSYERAARRGRKVDASDVANLVRLVLRRPDSEAILRDTGERVAAEYSRRVPQLWRRLAQALPARASLGLARRAARRMLRRIVGDGAVEVAGQPPAVRVRSVLAGLEPGTPVCVLYAAALESLVRSYSGERPRIQEQRCAAQGAGFCEWTIAEA